MGPNNGTLEAKCWTEASEQLRTDMGHLFKMCPTKLVLLYNLRAGKTQL